MQSERNKYGYPITAIESETKKGFVDWAKFTELFFPTKGNAHSSATPIKFYRNEQKRTKK